MVKIKDEEIHIEKELLLEYAPSSKGIIIKDKELIACCGKEDF